MQLRRFKAWTQTLCVACLLLAGWMLYHALSGGPMAGCGAGSACNAVMGSSWAYFLGAVPVSLPALAVYLLLFLCLVFLGQDRSLDRVIRPMMLILAGCVVGAALWFTWLQIGVIHAFCRYCTGLHLLGCLLAALIFFCPPQSSDRPPRPDRGSPAWLFLGLLAAALFAVTQSFTRPSALYDRGQAQAELPAFQEGEVPMVGREDAGREFTLLFDFQCAHCRRLHRLLPALQGYRILLAPVPLSSACNPYIPASGTDRFRGSCQLTRLAMAVWYARPEAYAGYWDYLLDGATPAEAENRARELLGAGFESARADSRIDAYLHKVEELFGRTSTQGSSGVPRFILGQQWLVPEVETPEALLNLLKEF